VPHGGTDWPWVVFLVIHRLTRLGCLSIVLQLPYVIYYMSIV
jgi:hypothetical protein